MFFTEEHLAHSVIELLELGFILKYVNGTMPVEVLVFVCFSDLGPILLFMSSLL